MVNANYLINRIKGMISIFSKDKKESINSGIKEEVVMLSGSEDKVFVPVFDNSKTYYGGKQHWFSEEFYRERGCGTVVAANICWYMSEYLPGCKNLYTKKDISKESFIEHMNEILPFIKPGIFGVPTIYTLGRGMIRYGRSKGVKLKAHYKSWRMESDEFIKSGLKLDSPVAMLQYYKKEGFNWHWQTITKYYKNKSGEEYIRTSNWGKSYYFDFEPFKNNKFVYFTVI